MVVVSLGASVSSASSKRRCFLLPTTPHLSGALFSLCQLSSHCHGPKQPRSQHCHSSALQEITRPKGGGQPCINFIKSYCHRVHTGWSHTHLWLLAVGSGCGCWSLAVAVAGSAITMVDGIRSCRSLVHPLQAGCGDNACRNRDFEIENHGRGICSRLHAGCPSNVWRISWPLTTLDS